MYKYLVLSICYLSLTETSKNHSLYKSSNNTIVFKQIVYTHKEKKESKNHYTQISLKYE